MKPNNSEFEKILQKIRYDRQMQRKRMYEQAIELIKGEKNPHVRAETRASTTLNTANIGNSACSCGCKEDTK